MTQNSKRRQRKTLAQSSWHPGRKPKLARGELLRLRGEIDVLIEVHGLRRNRKWMREAVAILKSVSCGRYDDYDDEWLIEKYHEAGRPPRRRDVPSKR
jgi:hypothetical protein